MTLDDPLIGSAHPPAAARTGEETLNSTERAMDNPIMKYFAFAHLPEKLQAVSRPIGELAEQMNAALPDGAEKSAGLRKLLEAKDCFVRGALP